VEKEEEAFECKSQFELIHPEWVLFVDECGSNTSQAKGGQVGGQTYLCSRTGRPRKGQPPRMRISLSWDLLWPVEIQLCAR
jgi:hypothetical protein